VRQPTGDNIVIEATASRVGRAVFRGIEDSHPRNASCRNRVTQEPLRLRRGNVGVAAALQEQDRGQARQVTVDWRSLIPMRVLQQEMPDERTCGTVEIMDAADAYNPGDPGTIEGGDFCGPTGGRPGDDDDPARIGEAAAGCRDTANGIPSVGCGHNRTRHNRDVKTICAERIGESLGKSTERIIGGRHAGIDQDDDGFAKGARSCRPPEQEYQTRRDQRCDQGRSPVGCHRPHGKAWRSGCQ